MYTVTYMIKIWGCRTLTLHKSNQTRPNLITSAQISPNPAQIQPNLALILLKSNQSGPNLNNLNFLI